MAGVADSHFVFIPHHRNGRPQLAAPGTDRLTALTTMMLRMGPDRIDYLD